ncbi:hypothetical protein RUM44_002657 [Polyplax serrata]|uniref:Disease resistance R13L4/SHOC-2-like LRR domain-containing protein n=1 Tax=Polyplax serrata TaxID=468196 RepID=A0ABR1AFD6_POLSC
MGAVKSCCARPLDDKLMVTKMDLSHCGCLEVPPVVFNAERCIETLILASNQITSLPPQLFHCQEMKHLNLNDNCLNSIPPAIGLFQYLVSLKLDKNNLQELPDNLKMCKKLKRLSLNSNLWKQMPNIVTQLISLEELYMNDCDLSYLPASVGRLAKLKIVELRNNNLCNLPLSMTRLELLTRLDISDNEFREFPACITKLKGLTELLLDNNNLEEIIDIKDLVNLEHLDASYNHITSVSETVGCCTNLNMLNLSYNYIEQLPNSIGNISQLQTLHLEMNELTEIPKSIGKLSLLEELNLCNNKLYSLPNTIGLLRNLRNLNVSRNIIEEFPSEIGSCTKLSIINAAYNRLQVLPSEIGYLNNLKVLDVVGNFLMYLPITIINLRGVRAIWLSANQNVPLIPFTEDLNLASGERFLTNIALPQLGEIPLRHSKTGETPDNEKTGTWNKKIRFAEDENLLPGKLHRTPTPFPKELRAPNRKIRTDERKHSENYANVIDGKVNERDVPLVQPPTSVAQDTSRISFSDGCRTRIREANIIRNSKDPDCETTSQNENGEAKYTSDCGQKNPVLPVEIPTTESQQMEISKPTDEFVKQENYEMEPDDGKGSQQLSSFKIEDNSKYSVEKCEPQIYGIDTEGNYTDNRVGYFGRSVIYSNLLNDEMRRTSNGVERTDVENERLDPQAVREMYHNDLIYDRHTRFPSAADYHNANVDRATQPRYQCTNSVTYRNNFIRKGSINSNHSSESKAYIAGRHPPPPPPPLQPLAAPPGYLRMNHLANQGTNSFRSDTLRQNFESLAEEMKNRNISPPCYEIAKMYSTKAALFENHSVDQLKSN